MAFTNFESKEIHCKVIYFGAPGSGKTANLKSIFTSTSAEVQSGLIELQDEGGSTLFFDFLPLSLGRIRDFHLKLHLFTIPLNSLYQTVPSVILKGVDGFVFVADSRVECMADNAEYLQRCRKIFLDEGFNVTELPRVIQYNKRDLPGAVPVEILRQELNPSGTLDFEAVATKGKGVVETLEGLARLMTKHLE
ncbi:MAG: gliding-motility protein MglA [Proteobacteria bacterium]|nr:gliding-motility protein MglA [Pseudomonadota bacterium]